MVLITKYWIKSGEVGTQERTDLVKLCTISYSIRLDTALNGYFKVATLNAPSPPPWGG